MAGTNSTAPTIHWTSGTKRLIPHRRGSPNKPKKPKPILGTMGPQDFREALWQPRLNFCRWLQQSGILTDTMQPEHVALAREMEEDWTSLSDAPLVLEHEALACYWWVTHWHRPDEHDRLFSMWLACEGPVFAIRALFEAHRLWSEIYTDERGPTLELSGDKIEPGIKLIRNVLASAPDDVYQQTKEAAQDLWKSTEIPYWRCALAFLFTDMEEWAKQCAQLFLETPKKERHGLHWLFASGVSLDLLKQMIAFAPDEIKAEGLAGAIDMHGLALFDEVFAIAARQVPYVRGPANYQKLLAVYVHPDVAAYFATHVDLWQKPIKVDVDYLLRFPELGRPALEDFLVEYTDPAECPLARKTLAQLRAG